MSEISSSTEEMKMEGKLLELAVGLVQAQASGNKMSSEEVESLLLTVYNTLFKMREAERAGRSVDIPTADEETGVSTEWMQDMEPLDSVQENSVVCLECGMEFRQLTANHLRTHEMTPREYKRKWGFPLKQPLAAKKLTRLRSDSAKDRGLPPKLQQYLEDQRKKKRSASSE